MIASVPSISPRSHSRRQDQVTWVATTSLAMEHGWRRLAFAAQVRRERRALARVPDAMLRDIGRSRADAAREAGRGFWDLPRDRD